MKIVAKKNRDLVQLWCDAWQPPDRRPPWQWAEQHVESISYSPIAGKFRSDNSPQIRKPMEAIVDPKVRTVQIIAAIQSGKTSAVELSLSYIVANLPGPTLFLTETDETAKDYSESRLQKLFEEVAPVRQKFPANRHKRRNSTVHFKHGMSLWCLGAHNKNNLQRRSIRWLFGDETWMWPQGHMAEAEARVTAFGWLGKCVFVSQGGEEGDDTDKKFQTTDMAEWTFLCPTCQTRQPFLWENIEWDKAAKGDEGWDYGRVRATTTMKCGNLACNHIFEDSDRTRRQLQRTGDFVPQNLKASLENKGFHWNSLATMSWGALAELYLRAKDAARAGDINPLKQFYQKRLALPWRTWEEDYKLEIAPATYEKGEVWSGAAWITKSGNLASPDTPEDQLCRRLLVMTVDVQLDHFYLILRAWSHEGSSRLVWHDKVFTYDDIAAIESRFDVPPALVFVDAGHDSFNVYRECAKRGWTALMGDKRGVFPHRLRSGKTVMRFYSPRRRVNMGTKSCNVHYFSNLNVKDCLARLRRNREGNGPTWEVYEAGEDYAKQMESEHRVQKNGNWVWEQIGSRPNHYFDCEVMSVCAALMLKLVGSDSVAAGDEVDEGTQGE